MVREKIPRLLDEDSRGIGSGFSPSEKPGFSLASGTGNGSGHRGNRSASGIEPRYAQGAVPESGPGTFSSSGEAGADSMGSSECMLIWVGPSLLWGT